MVLPGGSVPLHTVVHKDVWCPRPGRTGPSGLSLNRDGVSNGVLTRDRPFTDGDKKTKKKKNMSYPRPGRVGPSTLSLSRISVSGAF